MLLGLDHAIIAVRNLSRATEQFGRALGLTVSPGGQHPGMGTHNAIVRFGADYLELISVINPTEAGASERERVLLDFLQRGEGLLGFALGSDDLETDIANAGRRGIQLEGPLPGSRRRPDGSLMTWRTARRPSDHWGRKLPFLIQHDTPIQERRGWVPDTGHPLGATGIPAVSVAVNDLGASTEEYRRLLGEPPEVVEEVPALPARRARFLVGNFRVDLLEPMASQGGLAEFLRVQGEGLFLITLAVAHLERAVRFLREQGTAVGDPTAMRRAPLLDPHQTLGARFQLVEGK